MLMDHLLSFLTYLIIICLIPGYFLIKNHIKNMSYGDFLKFKPMVSTIIYISVSVLLCLSAFCKVKYRSTVIDITLLSIGTFLYSLYDIFYLQELKKDYIWKLQNQFIKKGSVDKLFNRINVKGVYLPQKENEKEDYSVIETENDGSCIFIGEGEFNTLKPKKPMKREMLEFYAKCLSLKMAEVPIFNKIEDFEFLIKNYQFFKPSGKYIFITKHMQAIKIILLVIAILLALALVFYLIAGSQNWFGLHDWINEEI